MDEEPPPTPTLERAVTWRRKGIPERGPQTESVRPGSFLREEHPVAALHEPERAHAPPEARADDDHVPPLVGRGRAGSFTARGVRPLTLSRGSQRPLPTPRRSVPPRSFRGQPAEGASPPPPSWKRCTSRCG